MAALETLKRRARAPKRQSNRTCVFGAGSEDIIAFRVRLKVASNGKFDSVSIDSWRLV